MYFFKAFFMKKKDDGFLLFYLQICNAFCNQNQTDSFVVQISPRFARFAQHDTISSKQLLDLNIDANKT